ncbi:MAG: hypothetical protein FJX80_04605 [Bacteroidetes bacterium]|nr:hypothetical protein [Bacteroidota bacterium]
MKLKTKNNSLTYFTVAIIWILAILIKLKFNGLVFGFDYGLYHPDGALYSVRALDWAGLSEIEAATRVSNWYNVHAFKFNTTSPVDLLYASHPLYEEYSTRVLYPLLSVPFVKLFGVPGMLVIPALSLLIFMLLVAKIGIRHDKRVIAVIVLFFVSSSSTVMRWMLSNTTDALLVAVLSLAGFLLVKRVLNTYWYLSFGMLILFSGITRISVIFWIAIACVLWFQKFKARSIYIVLFSFSTVIPTLLTHQSSSFLAVEGDRPFLEKLFLYPFYLVKVTFYEITQLIVLDRIFFLVCAFCVYLSLRNIHKESSQLFLLVLFAGLLTGALNGNVGVNFRYQLPVLFFICWSLIDNLNFSFDFFKRKNVNQKT